MTVSDNLPYFDCGTILVKDDCRKSSCNLPGAGYWQWDPLVGMSRCDACRYSQFRDQFLSVFGEHCEHNLLDVKTVIWGKNELLKLRRAQSEAISAWERADMRGVIVLPTGTGKTEVALAAMSALQSSTLIVVPIRDLMYQWHSRMLAAFGYDAGIVGDNLFNLKPVTITTYDSAAIHAAKLGNRFSLVVYDEVHHLPGQFRRDGAAMFAAPFRMGLTATPERSDGLEQDLDWLVGPVVYRQEISEVKGKTLADYVVTRIPVKLEDAERENFNDCSRIVREYMYNRRKTDNNYDWKDVLSESGKDPEARRAKIAFLTKQKIESEALEKFRVIEDIFRLHTGQRVIIFAGSNPMALKISKRFLIPTLLSHSRKNERRLVLEGFAAGTFPAIVANQVLDEGIDVPAAKVAIVVGGFASTRQAKQRLGRILRRSGDIKARLYEVVCETPGETQTSRRRRKSDAYERTRHRRI